MPSDKLVHYKEEESQHIVVYSRGRWYKLDLTKGKRLLNAAELEQQFQQVRQYPTVVSESLTFEYRTIYYT